MEYLYYPTPTQAIALRVTKVTFVLVALRDIQEIKILNASSAQI